MDLEEHIILTKLVDQVVLVVVLAVHLLVDILVDLLVEQELETLEELIIAVLHQMDGVMMVELVPLAQDLQLMDIVEEAVAAREKQVIQHQPQAIQIMLKVEMVYHTVLLELQ